MQPNPTPTNPPANPPAEQPPAPLPISVRLLAGALLAIPLVALALVPSYAGADPKLWGFPFFYWYQFLWVFLAGAFTWAAYLVVTHARRGARR